MSPLGVEAEITAFLTKHNLDGARFCRLVGPVISTTKLSAALNGLRSLDFEQTAAARKLMSAIDQLVELCCPLPISLRIRNLSSSSWRRWRPAS